jgi:CBS domain-containing protein
MTTRVITVSADTPVDEVVQTLLKWRISAVPVVDATGQMVGIVSEGDLVRRAESGTETDDSWWLSGLLEPDERARRYAKACGLFAKDVMTSSVITADEDDSVRSLATMLEENQIKRVPVVRKGRLVGIVSRANLLHGLVALPESSVEGNQAAEFATATTHKSLTTDDKAIRATILDRLHNEIGVGRAVNVIVSNGIVDLWGGVETETERQAIRAVAENAPNVSEVKDHLSVLPDAMRRLLGAD